LAGLIRQHGHPFVRYVAKQDLPSFVTRIARPGDTIFFLGAGDIGDLCHDVADRLRAPARTAC
jgi:UDP-N-acetylmuramate-alanine ligase